MSESIKHTLLTLASRLFVSAVINAMSMTSLECLCIFVRRAEGHHGGTADIGSSQGARFSDAGICSTRLENQNQTTIVVGFFSNA